MKQITILLIALMVVGVGFLSGCVEEAVPPIEPKTNFVIIEGKGNYTTIQEAIENASSGDTIYVYSGIYYENLAITKSVNLIGENRDTTIIIAKNNNTDVIEIARTTNVTISGFTLMNASKGNGIDVSSYFQNDNITISNCTIKNNFNGIHIVGSSNNKISNCSILSNNNTGIFIFIYYPHNYADNNTILNCTVSGNKQGVTLDNSNHNTIRGCNISNNVGKGIELRGASSNTVTYCEIFSNNYGIYISNYEMHMVAGIETVGVIYYNSTNNIIYKNDFISNTNQAYDIGFNIWSNATLKEGNYWSDYLGRYIYWYRRWIADDVPLGPYWNKSYVIPGREFLGRSNEDHYPLVFTISGKGSEEHSNYVVIYKVISAYLDAVQVKNYTDAWTLHSEALQRELTSFEVYQAHMENHSLIAWLPDRINISNDTAQVLVGLSLPSGGWEGIYHATDYFYLIQENGGWKINKISDMWMPE